MWKPDKSHHPDGQREVTSEQSCEGQTGVGQLRGDTVGQAGHDHPVLDLHWKELGAFFTREWLWLLSVALRDMSWFTNTDWVPPRNNPKHWGCTRVLCVSKGSVKGLSSSLTSALEEAKFPPSSGFPLALLFVWLLSPFWSLVTCQLFVLKQPTSN